MCIRDSPKSGKMAHPGLVLPPRFQSTSGLFPIGCHPIGSAGTLQRISELIPPNAPRFLSHDCTAMSTSVYSNFRKTAINFIHCTDRISTEHKDAFCHPDKMGLLSKAPKYRFGSPNEVYGGSELASMSGSGKAGYF
eukprot:TRINITY_DN9125_c0_g1_i1.p1 TRINITY_DN9125_c0_g1~~TRINITY_DN9125_c0_g1_i1.p1  ORF type:complete len:137 (+),score=24.08 TRINITY_DN9125_c0_g1_i1:138-548(+)